jgi:type II secretion system protein N
MMNQLLAPLHTLFRFYKLKALATLGIALLLFIFLFPNTDLSDMVSAQVAKATGIYVQMNDLSFDLLPSPGLGAKDVSIEPPRVPPLKVGGAHAAFMVTKLITAKLGATANLEKIFRGDVGLSFAQGDKAKSGERFAELDLHADRLSLDDVSDYLKSAGLLGVKLQGNLKVDSNMKVDPGFADQPNGTSSLEIAGLSVPGQSIMVDFNGVPVPQQIPTLDIGRVSLKTLRMNDGTLEIQDLNLGDTKSEISGKIRGSMGLRFRKNPVGVQPEISNVDLAMDITVDKDFLDRNQKTVIGGFLILVPANLQQDTAKGKRLAFRMKLARMGDIPNFTPLEAK